jgi:peroxiredoxin
LRAYQRILPQLRDLGAELVAVSPQTADSSLTMQEKNELGFQVLSDPGNRVARSLGLVWQYPPEMQAIYEQLGRPLRNFNGDDAWELPVPATFVVRPDGAIAFAFVDVDYTRRLEPDALLDALGGL